MALGDERISIIDTCASAFSHSLWDMQQKTATWFPRFSKRRDQYSLRRLECEFF